jgi:hypothetical protein
MSPDHEDPPELRHVRKALERANEAASHLEVRKVAPDPAKEREVAEIDEIRRQTERALTELDAFEHGRHSAAQIVQALTQSTATIVAAMKANADQLGSVFADQGGTAFDADPAVLAEGEFLKAQLTGVVGTEGGSPLLKDAPTTLPPGGLDLLTDAVNPPDTSVTPFTR